MKAALTPQQIQRIAGMEHNGVAYQLPRKDYVSVLTPTGYKTVGRNGHVETPNHVSPRLFQRADVEVISIAEAAAKMAVPSTNGHAQGSVATRLLDAPVIVSPWPQPIVKDDSTGYSSSARSKTWEWVSEKGIPHLVESTDGTFSTRSRCGSASVAEARLWRHDHTAQLDTVYPRPYCQRCQYALTMPDQRPKLAGVSRAARKAKAAQDRIQLEVLLAAAPVSSVPAVPASAPVPMVDPGDELLHLAAVTFASTFRDLLKKGVVVPGELTLAAMDLEQALTERNLRRQ